MTSTHADLGLSPDAAARFADYLLQVRAALAGSLDVNPDEIETDIREHVERELLAAPRPIPLVALDAVLTRLGPPSQWGTGEDRALWHRAKHLLRERIRGARAALWRGPEDWRLAYLSFGVFALGLLTFGFLLPVCLPVSYLLSRAGLEHVREKGLTLGARKWLLYPPVVLVSLLLLIAVVAWPIAVGGLVAEEVSRAQESVQAFDRSERSSTKVRNSMEWQKRQARVEEDRKLLAAIPANSTFAPAAAGLFVGLGSVLLWWTILGAVAAGFPGAVRAVFHPLCARLESRHARWLAVPCFLLLIPWSAAAYEVLRALM